MEIVLGNKNSNYAQLVDCNTSLELINHIFDLAKDPRFEYITTEDTKKGSK
jgi:hypothetical protein